MFRPRKRKKKETEKPKKSVTEKVKAKMEKMVKSREWLNLYDCLYVHCKALEDKFGKAPKLSKSMSLAKLQKLYEDIHADKYGHL